MDLSYVCGAGIEGPALYLMAVTFGLFTSAGAAWAVGRAGRALYTEFAGRVVPVIGRWRATRRVAALPEHWSSAEFAEGDVVRLRGVVRAESARPARLSGVPSVACVYAIGERGGGWVDHGTTAQDFVIGLGDETAVRVLAGQAAADRRLRLWAGRPQRWRRGRVRDGWFSEARITPGDEVEVVGRLVRQIDPSAPRLGDRQPGLRWVVMAAPGDPRGLWLNLCARPASELLPLRGDLDVCGLTD